MVSVRYNRMLQTRVVSSPGDVMETGTPPSVEYFGDSRRLPVDYGLYLPVRRDPRRGSQKSGD